MAFDNRIRGIVHQGENTSRISGQPVAPCKADARVPLMTDTQPLPHRCISSHLTPYGMLTMRTVLMEYECDPLLFVVDATNPGEPDRVYLVQYVDDPDDWSAIYMIARSDETTIENVLRGAIPLRDVFTDAVDRGMMKMTASKTGGPDLWEFYPVPDPIPDSLLPAPGAVFPGVADTR